MINLLRITVCVLFEEIFHTSIQAGPEILMIAIAARPGAVDKAKTVGSSSC